MGGIGKEGRSEFRDSMGQFGPESIVRIALIEAALGSSQSVWREGRGFMPSDTCFDAETLRWFFDYKLMPRLTGNGQEEIEVIQVESVEVLLRNRQRLKEQSAGSGKSLVLAMAEGGLRADDELEFEGEEFVVGELLPALAQEIGATVVFFQVDTPGDIRVAGKFFIAKGGKSWPVTL